MPRFRSIPVILGWMALSFVIASLFIRAGAA